MLSRIERSSSMSVLHQAASKMAERLVDGTRAGATSRPKNQGSNCLDMGLRHRYSCKICTDYSAFTWGGAMRLSLQTDYSLRTLMFLATKPGRHTVADVAEFFQISQTHVGKIVHQLARQGYLRSIRGIGGGFELARSPDEIRIGEVIQSVEGQVHLLECISVDDVCVIQKHCKLRTVLNRAERMQIEYLNSVRLSDVLPFGSPVKKLAREPKSQTAKRTVSVRSKDGQP